jgi:hypothetical protein
VSRRAAPRNLGRGPGCAREGVFGLQAAGASHWAAARYSSTQDYDSAINRTRKPILINDGTKSTRQSLHLTSPQLTMANTPLSGRDGKIFKSDLGLSRSRFFLQRGWTGFRARRFFCPSGKSLTRKHCATRCENGKRLLHIDLTSAFR